MQSPVPEVQLLLRGPVRQRVVGAEVAHVPVGLGLDQGGTVAPSGSCYGFPGDLEHIQGRLAIHRHARHGVPLGPIGDRGPGDGVLDRRGLGVAVVLADEQHGELPDRRKVHGLVQAALVGGAVPEEDDR